MTLESVIVISNNQDRADLMVSFVGRYLSQPTNDDFTIYTCTQPDIQETLCIGYSGEPIERLIVEWNKMAERLRTTFNSPGLALVIARAQ